MDKNTIMENLARALQEKDGFNGAWLYPIGENEFGRKGGLLKLTFGDSCVAYDDLTCKKL